MALSDKNLIITPNIGSAADPKIVFSGADASTGAQNITATIYPTNGGMLSFEGSAGQLFSITNSMSGTIFSANDVSGIPSIEVLDTGLIKLGQYSGNVVLGSGTDTGLAKLQVTGNITQNGNQVLHAGNYNSYSPTLTGTGASGTWGINVTGNAATASGLQTGAVTTGPAYFRKTQTDGDYTTAALWTESYGTTTTGIAFHISGTVGKFLEMRTNGTLYWNNDIILHSSNYNSYSPTLTGTGASGTWGINVTGNAATATALQTARTLTIGNTGKSVNGSADVSWTVGEIGAEVQPVFGVPRNNLGDPTVREMATIDGQFNNKIERYDISKIFVETSTNNITWTAFSITDAQKRILVGGDASQSSLAIPYGTAYFRIRMRADAYVFLNAFYAYWSGNGHSTSVKVFRKHDLDANWTAVTNSSTAVNSWPGHLYLPHDTIPWHVGGVQGTHNHEVYVVFQPTWNATYPSNPISLYKVQWWGGYPAGRRNVYSTDEFGGVAFPAEISAVGAITQNGSQVLHAGNYNSYSPTLTGTGASGTWGINVTGNAANVTGTVAIANGGTGSTTLTANNVLLGNGTSALQAVAPGTSGNILTSNGTTWQSVAPAGSGANVQTFTTVGTSTWTKPTGTKFVQIETWGGGGGGGGGQTGAAATNRAGGNGGAGGAYSTRIFTASEIPSTVSVTVGAGGTGGLANVNGTAGGNSSFGTFVIGYAGGAGLRGNGSTNTTPNSGAGVLGIEGSPANGVNSGQFGAGGAFLTSSGSPSGYGGGGGGAGTAGQAGGNGGASYQGGGGGGAGGGINTANTLTYGGAGGSPQGTMYYGTGGNPASAGFGVRTFGTSPAGGFRSGGAGGIAAPASADAGWYIDANYVIYANGIFVFPSHGIIYQSVDGITWTTSQNVTGVYLDGSGLALAGTSIIWDGVQWIIADRLGCIFTSPDLIVFTKQLSVLVTIQGTTLTKLIYANGKYIAVAANGSVFTSSNLAIGWEYALNVGTAAYDACWDGSYWIVVGALTVARSSDFVTWIKYTKAFNIFSCVSNFPVSNRTIFGTSSGNYYTDDGGLTTTITTGSVASGYPNQIIWDGARFVSGNTSLGGGVSWSNADGTTWTNTGSIGGGNVGGPAYNGTNYVITVSARTSSYYSSSLPTFTQSPVVPIWYAGNGGWGGIAGGGGGGGAGITGSTTGSKGGNGGSGMVRICSW